MDPQLKTFMSGSPVAVEASESALGALDLMVEHGFRHLPVVDGKRRVHGVLSFDDLRAAFPGPISLTAPPDPEERLSMRDVSVGEVMSFAPVTAKADVPLEDAAQLLATRRIGCLPIVDDEGCLSGIITETDMLHALATLLWTRRRGSLTETETEPEPASEDGGLLETLRAEQAHLVGRLHRYEQREQEITEQRREGPLDLAEEGAQTTEAEFTEELAEFASRRLRALEHALERAEAGMLGHCEGCGGRIPAARLRALPGATLCIRCARRSEDGA